MRAKSRTPSFLHQQVPFEVPEDGIHPEWEFRCLCLHLNSDVYSVSVSGMQFYQSSWVVPKMSKWEHSSNPLAREGGHPTKPLLWSKGSWTLLKPVCIWHPKAGVLFFPNFYFSPIDRSHSETLGCPSLLNFRTYTIPSFKQNGLQLLQQK